MGCEDRIPNPARASYCILTILRHAWPTFVIFGPVPLPYADFSPTAEVVMLSHVMWLFRHVANLSILIQIHRIKPPIR
jgi:hypothetical protein